MKGNFYCLIYDKIKGFYYIRVVKGNTIRDVTARMRSCGYSVSRVYNYEKMKGLKDGGLSGFLEDSKKHKVEMWEAVKGVEM